MPVAGRERTTRRCPGAAGAARLGGDPRILQDDPDPPVKVQPLTALLRDGLDQAPAAPYFLAEEEVSRAGTRVMQTFERTRWTDGRVYTWLRAIRQTGRGEGSSGLAFDYLENVKTS